MDGKILLFLYAAAKVEFQVTLEVLVDVQMIEMESVHFTETPQEIQGIKIPIINKVI